MIIYGFNYNFCIHESAPATISLHLTREGAEKALKEHQLNALDEFNEYYGSHNPLRFVFGQHESWGIEEFEVLE